MDKFNPSAVDEVEDFTMQIKNLKQIQEVSSPDEARQIAIDWQNWQAEQSLSMSEIAEYGNYFHGLATKFNLVEEFKENGII